jgi:hypothetical protein
MNTVLTSGNMGIKELRNLDRVSSAEGFLQMISHRRSPLRKAFPSGALLRTISRILSLCSFLYFH